MGFVIFIGVLSALIDLFLWQKCRLYHPAHSAQKYFFYHMKTETDFFHFGQSINLKFEVEKNSIWIKRLTQRAEAILNKSSNNINKTYNGLISELQGFQKCIA